MKRVSILIIGFIIAPFLIQSNIQHGVGYHTLRRTKVSIESNQFDFNTGYMFISAIAFDVGGTLSEGDIPTDHMIERIAQLINDGINVAIMTGKKEKAFKGWIEESLIPLVASANRGNFIVYGDRMTRVYTINEAGQLVENESLRVEFSYSDRMQEIADAAQEAVDSIMSDIASGVFDVDVVETFLSNNEELIKAAQMILSSDVDIASIFRDRVTGNLGAIVSAEELEEIAGMTQETMSSLIADIASGAIGNEVVLDFFREDPIQVKIVDTYIQIAAGQNIPFSNVRSELQRRIIAQLESRGLMLDGISVDLLGKKGAYILSAEANKSGAIRHFQSLFGLSPSNIAYVADQFAGEIAPDLEVVETGVWCINVGPSASHVLDLGYRIGGGYNRAHTKPLGVEGTYSFAAQPGILIINEIIDNMIPEYLQERWTALKPILLQTIESSNDVQLLDMASKILNNITYHALRNNNSELLNDIPTTLIIESYRRIAESEENMEASQNLLTVLLDININKDVNSVEMENVVDMFIEHLDRYWDRYWDRPWTIDSKNNVGLVRRLVELVMPKKGSSADVSKDSTLFHKVEQTVIDSLSRCPSVPPHQNRGPNDGRSYGFAEYAFKLDTTRTIEAVLKAYNRQIFDQRDDYNYTDSSGSADDDFSSDELIWKVLTERGYTNIRKPVKISNY